MAVQVGADVRSHSFGTRPHLYVIDPNRPATLPASTVRPALRQHAILRRRRLMRRARQAGNFAAWTVGGIGLLAVTTAGMAGLVH